MHLKNEFYWKNVLIIVPLSEIILGLILKEAHLTHFLFKINSTHLAKILFSWGREHYITDNIIKHSLENNHVPEPHFISFKLETSTLCHINAIKLLKWLTERSSQSVAREAAACTHERLWLVHSPHQVRVMITTISHPTSGIHAY